MLVYNNRGSDKPLLERFNEASWNNPIVRYMDDKENDLVKRKALVLTVPETAQRMTQTLRNEKRDVPKWLEAAAVPMRAKAFQQATFSMY